MARSTSIHKLSPLVLLFCFAVHASQASDSRYDGQPIQSVEYVGLRSLSSETLDYYLFGAPFERGRRLDLDDLDRHVKTLWQRDLVDDLRIESHPIEGGIALIVVVVERPLLVSVDYVGLKRLTRADIAEQIDRERVNVTEGQPLFLGELQRLKLVIEELYKEKGFRFAQVSFELEETTPGQQRAVFTVDEGDKVKIGDIDFDGNTIYGDWRLRQAMKKTRETSLITRFTKKDVYNPAHLDEDLDSVKTLYKKSGYKDVLIGDPEIGVEARNPGAETIRDQKRSLVVTVPIEEGDRWQLGEIRLVGNEVMSEEILRRQFGEPRGGWLRSKTIDDGLEKIDKLYKSIGYVFAQVDAEIVEAEPGVADVVVRIDERDQFRVGRLEFEGNTKTQDKVLRRQLFLQEGSVMNMTAVQNSLLRIRQLSYFTLDEEEPVRFDFDSGENVVDLEIQGEEGERTDLQFGGGWSEPDGFFGYFSSRTSNFLGRGETLGFSVQLGQERELFDFTYGIPWFLDRPQNVSFRLFQQDQRTRVTEDFEYDREWSGASLTYGRNLRGFHSINFSYNFTDIYQVDRFLVAEEDDVDDGEQDGIVSRTTEVAVSSIVPSWRYDTLDSRFEPTRGLKAAASFEVAGGWLGGESSYLRPRAELTWFRPVSRKPLRSSFGVKVKAGWFEPSDDSEILSSQRFYLGGDSSIRGFRTSTISVREAGLVPLLDSEGSPVLDDAGEPITLERPIRYDENGVPLGGDKMFQLNLEYHVLTGGPFRVVLFADAGGVFARDQAMDPDLMRYTAGAELRVSVPIFPAPLRFIYASNLDPLPDDSFKSFNFSLSTSF